jgi:hypothetical protein
MPGMCSASGRRIDSRDVSSRISWWTGSGQYLIDGRYLIKCPDCGKRVRVSPLAAGWWRMAIHQRMEISDNE